MCGTGGQGMGGSGKFGKKKKVTIHCANRYLLYGELLPLAWSTVAFCIAIPCRLMADVWRVTGGVVISFCLAGCCKEFFLITVTSLS